LAFSDYEFKACGGATRPLPETQQSGHAPRSGPEVKNGSNAKNGASERPRRGTIQDVSQIPQRAPAELFSSPYPA